MKEKRFCNIEALVDGSIQYSGDVQESYVYVYPVVSPIASGRLVSIEFPTNLDGFITGYTAADIPGENAIGAVTRSEEPLLATDSVHYIGQPVGFVVAESYEGARKAARLTKVTVEDTGDAILTIAEARKRESYYNVPLVVASGDLDEGFSSSDIVIEDFFDSGAQEHAYIETQRAFASFKPFTKDILVHGGTQAVTDLQQVIALLLGISETNVEVDVYRVGGAFGGKERGGTMWAAMAALSLVKTGRPSALILDRADDLAWTGKRHPYHTEYKVGFSSDGIIKAMDCALFANGGWYEDFTEAIMERSVLAINSCYYIPAIRIAGYSCKTNYPANTAFRGFGAPQASLVMEEIIYQIAERTGLTVAEVQRRNFYEEGEKAPFDMPMVDIIVSEMHRDLVESEKYRNALKEIEEYNKRNRYSKKGLGIVPVKYGIGFTNTFLNQGNALVYVYSDGSVAVSHGGIEMGQGLFTKIELIVAKTLGVDPGIVTCMSTNSLRAGSVCSTAASTGTDINGAAARLAASKVRSSMEDAACQYFEESCGMRRNKEYIRFENGKVWDIRNPGESISFKDLAAYCYFHQYNLGAQAHYATPGMKYDIKSGKGFPFAYFTNGVAMAVVEVDTLTGCYHVESVTIKHEGGSAIDKAIDLGQVTGGFIQGMGYVTMEDFPYSEDGSAKAISFSQYKVPLVSDLPDDFDITLVPTDREIAGVLGSKGVGEPPLMYGVAVFSALRDAVTAARGGREARLEHPATPMNVLKAIKG